MKGDRQPLLRQLAHQCSLPSAVRAQWVGHGDAALVEEQLRCIGGEMTELVEIAAMPKTCTVAFDKNKAHAARSAVRVGAGDHDDEVAHLPVRDEGLLA